MRCVLRDLIPRPGLPDSTVIVIQDDSCVPTPVPPKCDRKLALWVFSTFIAWCQKTGQRTSSKSLGTQKREHILEPSRKQRTPGVGATNPVSGGGSSARDGCGSQGSTVTWECNSHREGRRARNLSLTRGSNRMKERQPLQTWGFILKHNVFVSLPAGRGSFSRLSNPEP